MFSQYTECFPVQLQLSATGNIQTRVAFLPFGSKLLKTLKPVPYERQPQTLGQHLKKRRLKLDLRQRDVQERFKLDKETYANWEKDRRLPAMKHWPGIIEFLGFDPNQEPISFGNRLLAYRRRNGLSRKALATSLDIDEATLWRWENDHQKPRIKKHIDAVERWELVQALD